MASFPAAPVQESKTIGPAEVEGAVKPPEQGLKCPRCDSPNTKFCYYNNYSLSQPRYFCKTCRRYWTKGGALRNVPVGGGCRKSNKPKSSASFPSSSPSSGVHREHKFLLRGLSSMADFNLPSGLSHASSSSGIFNVTSAAEDHVISYGDFSYANAAGAIADPPIQLASPPYTGIDLILGSGGDLAAATGVSFKGGDLTASIESLSSMNQGLHWKLQQQRLGSLFGGKEMAGSTHALLESLRRPIPAAPHGSSREENLMAGGAAGWFVERNGAYAAPAVEEHADDGNGWSGDQAWSGAQHHPFSALP